MIVSEVNSIEMISKKILILILTLIIGIHTRKIYYDTNWGDPDPNDDDNNWYRANNNWDPSNRLAQPNLLDYHGDAKAQEANWIRGAIKFVRAALTEEAIRNIFNYIPRGMLIAPAEEMYTKITMSVEEELRKRLHLDRPVTPITEHQHPTNRTTKSWKRKKNKT